MDVRDWNKFLFPYEQAIAELKVKFRTLRSEVKMIEHFSPIEFVTGRVKRVSSILEKSSKLDVSMDELETGIEDIAGIRIMCQFVEDITKVAAYIRNRQDMTVVYEKDYITYKKESGYRSYHIIVNYPVQSALGMKTVLVEIQIRTLAMNFWATIEHSLHYKYKEDLPPQVQLRLEKAAEAAYQLDQEMSNIREEIVDAQANFEDDANTVNIVLHGIQKLYFYHQVGEALNFQNAFYELWDKKDFWKIKELSEEINQSLSRVKGDRQ